MRRRGRIALLGLAVAGGLGAARSDEAFYIQRGAVFRYFRGLAEPSPADLPAWRQLGFDDAAWPSGPAPFGYGDPPYGTDLGALDPPMQNNYSTLFLRRDFEVTDPARVAALEANVNYDDGFIAWLNGVEVLRVNVAGQKGDPVAATGIAAANREPGRFQNVEIPEPNSLLVTGTNVLAVMGFNAAKNNNDFKFDLELFDPRGPDLSPPALSLVVPGPGATVRRLPQLEATFSEEVSGVDPADLLLNGAPAALVSGSGAGPYRFTFAQPPAGRVEASWAQDHGIHDLSDHPNPFAGGSWSYTLDPAAPPPRLVIGEFLAAGGGATRDEDGEFSDWIEIENRGEAAVSLAGFGLTDDADEPNLWTFPGITLAPGARVLVFATGKDRKPSGGNLHTNFQLSAAGEYLGLFSPEAPPEPVAEFTPRFPEQRRDVSFGLDGEGRPGYFESPTPGGANGGALAFRGFAGDPVARPPRGFYEAPIEVALSSRTPGAAIRYTLDGSEPSEGSGTLYTGPIPVAGNPRRGAVTLRAAAFKEGWLPSRSTTHTYIFIENVLTQPPNPDGFPRAWGAAPGVDYEMDPQVVGNPLYHDSIREGLRAIPSVSVVGSIDDIFGPRGIYSNPLSQGPAWEKAGSAELIHPDGREGFQVNCGVQIQGGASRQTEKSPKHALRLLFKGDYGPSKLNHPVFPGSPVESFDVLILRAGFNNTWIHWNNVQRARAQFVHDQWARDTQIAMGGLSGRGIFVHLYLNGLYWGLYNLVERPTAAFAASHLGGEKEEYDALNAGVPINGNALAWSALMSLGNAGLGTLKQYEAIQDHLDVTALADYMILNFYGANQDWPGHNWYAVRRREPGAGFLFVSWDAERILEGLADNRLAVSDAGTPAFLHQRLLASPEYRLLLADRIHKHLGPGGALSPEKAVGRFRERMREVDPAVVAESARWGDYRRDVHQWQDPPYEFYTRNTHFTVERARLEDQYFPRRTEALLGQFRALRILPALGAPVLSHPGGAVEPGLALSMELPAGGTGTIYYTTDGSDPRIYGTGQVSPSAAAYTAPLIVDDALVVRARALAGATWSALSEAVFRLTGSPRAVRITEVMYHPAQSGEPEFIEIENTGPATVALSGWRFADGVQWVFPRPTLLAPGGRLVLASDAAAFEARSPGVAVAGVFGGALDNGGEKLSLVDEEGQAADSVDYDDEGLWPIAPDGFGHSLVREDPEADPNRPESWRASAAPGGSPGAEDPPPRHGGVVVSEVLARAQPPLEGAIELQNLSGREVSLGGWFLSNRRDGEEGLKRFRIPDGTVIAAGGFRVFYERDWNAVPGGPGSFALDEAGGEVYLSAAGRNGKLTGAIAAARYRAPGDGVSYGRVPTSVGADFAALAAATFGPEAPGSVEEFRGGKGAPNAGARTGPVVVSEVLYHPGRDHEEFVELQNLTGEAVALHDPALGRGWRLGGLLAEDGIDDFELPPGATIPARGLLLIVGDDPEAFRARHSIPREVPIHGPFGGALDNGGESLRLYRPERSRRGAELLVQVDAVRYDDEAPWPAAADGAGASLERVLASGYGNDPANWESSVLEGGTPGALNSRSPPAENRLPAATFAIEPRSGPPPLQVALDASASSDADGSIARFEWDLGDGAVGEGPKLVHSYGAPGAYTVLLAVIDDQGGYSTAAGLVVVEEPRAGGGQVPGDANGDGRTSISDAIVLLLHLFFQPPRPLPCEGGTLAGEGNRRLADLNGDGAADVSDAVHFLAHLFLKGPEPVLGIDCVPIAGCPDACVP